MKNLFTILMLVSMLAVPSLALAGISNQEDLRVVGDDIIIGDGEMKIISFDGEVDAVVGDNIEIEDGMAKIISIDADVIPVVGDDIAIGEGEAKIISIDKDPSSSLPIIPISFGAGSLVLLSGGLIYRKKILG